MKIGTGTTQHYLFFLLLILVFGCSSSFKDSQIANSQIEDDSDYDSFDSVSFQLKNQHPSRSTDLIKSQIDMHKNEILDLLNDYHKTNSNKDLSTLTFQISCNGKTNCIFGNQFKVEDSLILSRIEKVINEKMFDSLQSCNSIAAVHCQVVLNPDSSALIFSPVVFYQIRSKSSIMRIVLSKMEKMRFAYNRHLKHEGNFKGKLKVKFAINELGNVVYQKILENTTGNEAFANEELELIKTWQFPRIHNPNDITEVVYPFVFQY